MGSAIHRFTLSLLAGLTLHSAQALAACEAKSGIATAALFELYTSEGCNTCPPADDWLANLTRRGFGLDRVVPLAFHVDYWDRLGWRDRFSQKQFTNRQHEFARLSSARSVYTPEIVLNGREYRHWRFANFSSEIARINDAPARADIHLRLDPSAKIFTVTGTASLKQGSAPAGLYLALYENNLSSNVTAGENRGRILHHEFVVRTLLGPFALTTHGPATFKKTFALDADWKFKDLGVAGFIQESNRTTIRQALALPVCAEAKKIKSP
jgi:hypothetical protein